MRAGCFAEDRVIDLINRRFVPFFFNRGGPGEGKDSAADAFVNGQTENPYAYLAAFRPTGEIVGETALYADKNAVADFLMELLRKYPEYAQATAEEEQALGADAGIGGLEGARLREELGDYAGALTGYGSALDGGSAPERSEALLGTLRITRYLGEWDQHEAAEARLRQLGDRAGAVHADMERGYRLLAGKEYGAARELLQPLTMRALQSGRAAEAHFYAGVACWFLGDRDWAKFHWVWILENLPEDRLYSRARVAAAAESMPYPNYELGGFKADVGNIGTGDIVAGVQAATEVYRGLIAAYGEGRFGAAMEGRDIDLDDPVSLVSGLRDGNPFVQANNKLVDRLVAIGEPSIEPLVAAIQDREGVGRGYSGWALGVVLASLDTDYPGALAVLREAASDRTDRYVSALSASGLRQIGKADKSPEQGELSDSPLVLVAGLRDGNEFVPANNKLVEQLEAMGDRSLPALQAAVQDEQFPGRGYAAWALASVLKVTGARPPEAMELLEAARSSSNAYVSALARSGLSILE